MSKVLVSASHFDTLCQDAWKLFEDNGIDVVFDPAKEFPAYTTEEIENHPGNIPESRKAKEKKETK